MIRPHGDNASVDIVEEEVEDYENRTKDYRNAIYTIQYNDVHFDNNHTEEAGDKPDGASRASSHSDGDIEGRRRVRFSDAGVSVHEVPGRPKPNKCWRNTKRCLDYFCCCGCLFPRM